MDESVFLVLDFNAICRLCLSTRSRLLTDIFHTDNENADDLPPLHEQIALLTGVQISAADKLPQQICYKCRHLVDLCYELRETTESADRLLTKAASGTRELSADIQPDIEAANTGQTVTFKEELFDNPKSVEFYEPLVTEQKPDEGVTEPEDEDKIDEVKEEPPSTEHYSPAPLNKPSSPKRHFKKKKTRKNLTCEICLTCFPSRDRVAQHVREHYEGSELTPYVDMARPYSCERCDQRLPTKSQVVQHHLRHLNLNPFYCREPGCSFVGKSKDSLRHHGYSHGPPTLVCEACGAAFRRNSALQQHMIRHADKGSRFPCRRCDVVCTNRITYRTHVRAHDLQRSFKCERAGCPKAFLRSSELTVHMRSHDNDRIYRCHLCVSSYISRSQLTRHLRQHQRRRLNKCDKCCATFDNYAAFCNHRIGTHGAWQPHKCVGCNQGYQSEARLEKHQARGKLVLGMKSLLSADDDNCLDLPSPQQEMEPAQGLLCSEESMDTLDSLLLRNLKTQEPMVVAPADVAAGNAGAPVLAQDGLLYIEVDDDALDMEPYPSPPHQH